MLADTVGLFSIFSSCYDTLRRNVFSSSVPKQSIGTSIYTCSGEYYSPFLPYSNLDRLIICPYNHICYSFSLILHIRRLIIAATILALTRRFLRIECLFYKRGANQQNTPLTPAINNLLRRQLSLFCFFQVINVPLIHVFEGTKGGETLKTFDFYYFRFIVFSCSFVSDNSPMICFTRTIGVSFVPKQSLGTRPYHHF